MRLSKNLAVVATEELLTRLRAEPSGLRTSELIGSPRFHGVRTLKPRQIIRLLRECGSAEAHWEGCGSRLALRWRIKR